VILVATAGGTFGSRVAVMLAEADVPVRALADSRRSGEALEGTGVEVVYGDLDDPASVDVALRDAEQLFLATRSAAGTPRSRRRWRRRTSTGRCSRPA
jgi:uncharacterized protein YbjT (DUF2867 family)